MRAVWQRLWGPGSRKETTEIGIFVTNQKPLGTDMVSALDEQFATTHLARDRGWDAVGAATSSSAWGWAIARSSSMRSRCRRDSACGDSKSAWRSPWLGMPLAHALASMRLISDALLPALRQVKG